MLLLACWLCLFCSICRLALLASSCALARFGNCFNALQADDALYVYTSTRFEILQTTQVLLHLLREAPGAADAIAAASRPWILPQLAALAESAFWTADCLAVMANLAAPGVCCAKPYPTSHRVGSGF